MKLRMSITFMTLSLIIGLAMWSQQVVENAAAVRPATTHEILTEVARLTASDAAQNDIFGRSVAVSGETVVVGASLDNAGAGFGQGSVYVFMRDGRGLSQQAKLTASDGTRNDNFGHSVAISGETIVVGAPGSPAAFEIGAVYVFARSGTSWSQQAKLTASDGAIGDGFGFSVAINGETVVGGARFDDAGAGLFQGSAYVFARSGTSWNQQAKLTASDASRGGFFGTSVAISGRTVIVGAPGTRRSAYVFVRSGTSWSEQAILTASDGAVNGFGFSVAISGRTVVVQGPAGSASIFVRSGASWSEQAILTASDTLPDDGFGFSVAISGETVVVGAVNHNAGAGLGQGAAYVFVRNWTSWSRQAKLTASDGAAGDAFGFSVAISGETIVVGAFGDDDACIPANPNCNSGSAYIFRPRRRSADD